DPPRAGVPSRDLDSPAGAPASRSSSKVLTWIGRARLLPSQPSPRGPFSPRPWVRRPPASILWPWTVLVKRGGSTDSTVTAPRPLSPLSTGNEGRHHCFACKAAALSEALDRALNEAVLGSAECIRFNEGVGRQARHSAGALADGGGHAYRRIAGLPASGPPARMEHVGQGRVLDELPCDWGARGPPFHVHLDLAVPGNNLA